MAKKALVISGGGSKGAFAVGVLKYFQQHVGRIDQFDLYCGTSTGALIVPLAALGELGILEALYTTSKQTDILNMGGIGNLVTQVSLHDVTPLKGLIERTMPLARYQQLLALNKGVYLATVCLQTEQLVFFSTQPPRSTANYGMLQTQNEVDFQRAMLASTCQPVFTQPIEVLRNSNPIRQYVDGGVREITPLQVAIDNGATEILAITLSPKNTLPQNDKITKGMKMLERTIDMFTEDVSESDYRLPTLYREANAYLQAVKTQLRALGVTQPTIDQAFSQTNDPFAGKPIVTILEIRPDQTLIEGGPGGLTFDPATMQGMLAKGVARAKAFFDSLPPAQLQSMMV